MWQCQRCFKLFQRKGQRHGCPHTANLEFILITPDGKSKNAQFHFQEWKRTIQHSLYETVDVNNNESPKRENLDERINKMLGIKKPISPLSSLSDISDIELDVSVDKTPEKTIEKQCEHDRGEPLRTSEENKNKDNCKTDVDFSKLNKSSGKVKRNEGVHERSLKDHTDKKDKKEVGNRMKDKQSKEVKEKCKVDAKHHNSSRVHDENQGRKDHSNVVLHKDKSEEDRSEKENNDRHRVKSSNQNRMTNREMEMKNKVVLAKDKKSEKETVTKEETVKHLNDSSEGSASKKQKVDDEVPTDTEEGKIAESTALYSALRGYSVCETDRVFLNVGGEYFETSLPTLMMDPKSLFSMTVNNGELRESRTLFFDRDPTHFRLVINHLRNRLYTDTRTLPETTGKLLECLQEAQYYELASLQQAIVSKLEQLTVVSPLALPRWTYPTGQ